MLWTKVRCQTLRPHFTWSHKPLFHPTRQFSHTAFRPFLRHSRCLRQEISPNASLRENVHLPAHSGPSFYEKISKPGIWKQVTVGCVNSFTCGVADLSPPQVRDRNFISGVLISSDPDYHRNWVLDRKDGCCLFSMDPENHHKHGFEEGTNSRTHPGPYPHKMSLGCLYPPEYQGLRESLANMQSIVQHLPVLIRPWINLACVSVMQPYADATEGKRLCWKICLLNAGVWLAWKLKPLNGFMTVRFMHYPLSGLSYTLLTSMFRYAGFKKNVVGFCWTKYILFYSHRSALHLLCNCLALESFGKGFSESSSQKTVLYLFQVLRHTTIFSANRTRHNLVF